MKPAMTTLRRAILEYIEASRKPVTAKKIHSGIQEKADLSSIYRALDYFENTGMVNSLAMGCSRFYYASRDNGHGHFLYCRNCHEIVEFTQCAIASLQKKIQQQYDYEISGHVLYFEGLCPDCREFINKNTLNNYSSGETA